MIQSVTTSEVESAASHVEINEITLDHPWQWLAAGWKDLQRAPGVSLTYGMLFLVASYLLTLLAFSSELFFLIPPLAAGFFLLAPLLAIGLYDISRRLEDNDWTSLGRAFSAWTQNPFNLLVMGMVLMLSMLVWMMTANLVFAVFHSGLTPTIENFIPALFLSGDSPLFLAAGILSGGIIAFAVFCISVISVPMLMDRNVNVLTAIGTSISAVRKNPGPLLLWASLIVMFVVMGLVTFYIGLLVSMPLVGYASWHAYRDLVGQPGTETA
jgi:uncharacterized membrane protein